MIGLIPASGKSTRLNGLPKFALPYDKEGNSILSRHVKQMQKYCKTVVVSTTLQWKELVESLNLNIEVMIIEPSTMNDALLKMSNKYVSSKYLVGMADTFFEGENPYEKLYSSISECLLSIACWEIHDDLKGRVGQVKLENNRALDVVDKNVNCNYKYMWGALAFDRSIIKNLNSQNSHPGIDIPMILSSISENHYAFKVEGKYFDVGTMPGYKELINYLV